MIPIRFDAGGSFIAAELENNATAADFASLLPLTLTLTDYADTEKISDLPRKLSTDGAPHGAAASIGDIAYYAPWGNLAVFYKGFGHSSGLVRIGAITSGIEQLSACKELRVTIERVDRE
jgi:hypothetical protein